MGMAVRQAVLTVIGFLIAAPALGQAPAAAPGVPPQTVQLFDQVPNYADVLVHQWSAGVPEDVTAAERSIEHYGRLLEGGAPQPLSVGDCIALALKNNTDLQIQRLGPLAARTQVQRAESAFDATAFGNVARDRLQIPTETISPFTTTSPTLFQQNFTANAGVRKLLQSGGLMTLVWQNNRYVTNPSVLDELVPRYTTNLGLSLNQPLLRDFGWRYTLLIVEVAQTTEQQAYRQYEAAIAALITQVERVYWALVLATENITVQEQGLTLANEVRRQNEDKFKVGALPQTAVLEAKSEVARREANLIRFRNLRDVARDNLRAIINYPEPSGGSLWMIEPQEKPTVVPFDVDLDRSLRAALEQRPELAGARLDVHRKGLQRKVAENQLLPRLNFVGALGVNGLSGKAQPPIAFTDPTTGQSTVFAAPNPSLTGGYERALELLPDGRYYNYSAGAVIEIPIDNGQAKADYSAANIGLEQSRLTLQRVEESVTLEVKTAVSNLQTDLKSIDATRIARELAEENVRNQQARFDVGLATTKDLLDFQDRLTQARALEIDALTRYNSDLAEMRRVEGTLLAARNVIIERASPAHIPWWEQF